jgi:hypothetical protein
MYASPFLYFALDQGTVHIPVLCAVPSALSYLYGKTRLCELCWRDMKKFS